MYYWWSACISVPCCLRYVIDIGRVTYSTPLGSPRMCDISYLFTFHIYLSSTDAEMYAHPCRWDLCETQAIILQRWSYSSVDFIRMDWSLWVFLYTTRDALTKPLNADVFYKEHNNTKRGLAYALVAWKIRGQHNNSLCTRSQFDLFSELIYS